MNEEDEKMLEDAKNTIGDYKLKASLSLDFKNLPTVESKHREIIICRRKVSQKKIASLKQIKSFF